VTSPDPSPKKPSTGTMLIVGFIAGILTVVLIVSALR
jgi:uncharacterized protein involved in exopolysaccharide biosynthesis